MALIAPSILSADFSRIGEAVKVAEDAGADLIHLDVMDGHFVPNLTMGPALVASLRKRTRLPLDVHLMVENPRLFIPKFQEAGADWISFHLEASKDLPKDVAYLKGLGRKAGIALNPETPIDLLEEVLPDLDFVLLMSVHPGRGGQSFIPSCLDKIRNLKAWIEKKELRVPIEVDGGIKLDNLEKFVAAGTDIIVAGSAIFEAEDPAAVIRDMKFVARAVKTVQTP